MQVVVAIIYNSKQEILLTQRGNDSSHPRKWEFPGGKVQENETADDALVREIKEELGLTIQSFSLFEKFTHVYEYETITLIVYEVISYTGLASCMESQLNLIWTKASNLENFSFPDANYKIITRLTQ